MTLAIPRIRDFRGLNPRSFDGRGNYTFGVTEQLIFPEIDYDRVDASRGMDITIVTTAVDDAGGKALLDAYGFPFKKGEDAGPKPVKKRRGPVRGGPKGKPQDAACNTGDGVSVVACLPLPAKRCVRLDPVSGRGLV